MNEVSFILSYLAVLFAIICIYPIIRKFFIRKSRIIEKLILYNYTIFLLPILIKEFGTILVSFFLAI